MTTSLFREPETSVRDIGSRTGTAASGVRIPLNKDLLTTEHEVHFTVTQAFTGAPTSVDVGMFIESIAVEATIGSKSNSRILLDGISAFELVRMTEQQSSVLSTLAATSTAEFSLDLHHKNNNSLRPLLTALRSEKFSKLDLVIVFAPDNANGFIGGTVPLAASYTVDVDAKTIDSITDLSGISIDDGDGNEANDFADAGLSIHSQISQSKIGTSSGNEEFVLSPGNRTRFVQIVTLENIGGVLTRNDDIVGKIRLVVGGVDKRNVQFKSVQRDNETEHGMNRVGSGTAVIDFGDAEEGWLNLEGVVNPLLKLDIKPGLANPWEIRVAQDFSEDEA